LSDVNNILAAIERAKPHAAERLLPLVYDELRRAGTRRQAPAGAGEVTDVTRLLE
jgi:hypothetical protein